MSKKVKVIITGVICLLIIGIGLFATFSGNNKSDRHSKQFIESIKYIQDENYIKAYNNIKNSNKEERDIIQTIIMVVFTNEFDKYTDIEDKLTKEAENITDYLTYTYLYQKDDKYQQNINRIYDEEFSKLYDIKNKIPRDIMFEDTVSYYDLYLKHLDLANGIFRDYEHKVINEKDSTLNKINNITDSLSKITDEYESIIGKHPMELIPEEYRILLNLSESDD